MTLHERIEAYLAAELESERQAVDPRVRFVAEKARELYWTITRLIGLERLHDGLWRTPDATQAERLRETLAGEVPAPASDSRLLIDMTATHRYRKQTGVQRVVREIARACVEAGDGLPVYIEDGRFFSHFRHRNLPDEISLRKGDILLLLDSGWGFCGEYPALIEAARRAEAQVVCCLYDLIPLRYPGAAEPANCRAFAQWFESVVLKCDALACISRSVAEDFVSYVAEHKSPVRSNMRIGWWPLGADFREQTDGAPTPRAVEISRGAKPYFLSVGTLEPRKAYPVALSAFEKVWSAGLDVDYIIVGRRGWSTTTLERRIRAHPEFGRRLFWLDDASDADLRHLYRSAHALVFTSFVEGFGMPLVEAAHFGARVIASDIPVFREIGGDDVVYFPALDADALASRVVEILGQETTAHRPRVVSWRESAAALTDMVRSAAYQIDAEAFRRALDSA